MAIPLGRSPRLSLQRIGGFVAAVNGMLESRELPWQAEQKITRKIAVLGRAPSTIHLGPFNDPEWEIWSLGNAAISQAIPSGEQKGQPDIPRWNVWFELHDLDEKKRVWKQGYLDWLATDHGKTIYIGKPHPMIPHGTVYPWQDVFDKFGRYFNNSLSEMIALALLEGATELALYGVDMAQTDSVMHHGNAEYQHQRPSCEHMIGWARGMGVPVYIPAASDLCKTPRIYGFQSDEAQSQIKYKARNQELHQQHAHAIDQMKQAEAQAAHFKLVAAKFEGAIEDNDYWRQRI